MASNALAPKHLTRPVPLIYSLSNSWSSPDWSLLYRSSILKTHTQKIYIHSLTLNVENICRLISSRGRQRPSKWVKTAFPNNFHLCTFEARLLHTLEIVSQKAIELEGAHYNPVDERLYRLWLRVLRRSSPSLEDGWGSSTHQMLNEG